MFENNGYSLADVAAATGNSEAWGSGGAWWIIILFLFCFMGGGWNNNGKQAATTDDVQNQFNFAALERQNNETVAAVNQAAYDVTGALKDNAYALNTSIRDVKDVVQQNGYEINKGFANLSQQVSETKYDNLLNTQNIMKNDCDNTQKILDAITGNRMADMQNQIDALQLQAALAGVVRYPMAATYNAGYAPFYGPYGPNQPAAF